MKHLFLIMAFAISCLFIHAQTGDAEVMGRDSLLIINKNPAKGFYNDYILFIPEGTPLHQKTFLLVEPNNTGKLSDSMELHRTYAISLASESSVGNNISTELDIPLLVPIFPRPASKPYTYTHALDRDVMLEKTTAMQRLDLQLLNMIADAKLVLKGLMIETEEKIFMNGFSASATFTNRFSMIHPETIQALAMGGFNGELMLPMQELNGNKLPYPLGIHDFNTLFKQSFDLTTYQSIPQYIYMGKLDENDAVQFDDAYSKKERKIINEQIADNVQARYVACQKYYQQYQINAKFITFEEVGHWTTAEVNLQVILFFLDQMQKKK